MKPKKQTVTFNTKTQAINEYKYAEIKTATIENEVYYSALDFLKYLLLLDRNNRQLTLGYITNELNNFKIDTEEFWNNSDNSVFFDLVINHLNNYGDWYRGSILNSYFKSKLVNISNKLSYVRNCKDIPSHTYNFVIHNKNLEPELRATMLTRFQHDSNTILNEIIPTEEEKVVLSAALSVLDINKITSQNLINIYIQDKQLREDRRIDLIKKSTNLEVLKHLIFTDESFSIVKAARLRIKELPNTVKLLNEFKESEAA